MPQFVNVTLKNDTMAQHVYHATDNVLGQSVLQDAPLGPSETTPIRLVADENGHGQMTCGFRGGIDTVHTDLNDGDEIDN
jgi:hypothetical protein